jgi:hypothetical protein
MFVKIYCLYFMITLSVFSITVTSFQAFAVEEIWEDYERMGEMVKDIKNGDKDDDKVDYNKFKDSAVYKNEKEDVRNCIDLANKVGEKLGDYEIVRCFENTNYFEEKYVDDEDSQTTEEVNPQEGDDQNMTRNKAVSDADQQREQEQQQQREQEQQQQREQEQQQQREQEQQQQQERPTSDTTDSSTSDDITENNLINELVKTGKFTEDEAKEFVSQNRLSGANISSTSDVVIANDTQATSTDEQQEQEQQQEQADQNQTRLQIMANASQTASSKYDSNSTEGCDSSYPEICITTYSAKLICADIPFRNFKVILPDTHGFDSDADGTGCEE